MELSVRSARNGVIVSTRDDLHATVGKEYVFVDPESLGDWMEKWYSDVMNPVQKTKPVGKK